MLSRTLLAVAVLLTASASFGQTIEFGELSTRNSLSTFARDHRPSPAEISMLAGGGASAVGRWAVRAGKVLPYVGYALMAYEVVDAALDWNAARGTPVASGDPDLDCQTGAQTGPVCDGYGEPLMPGTLPRDSLSETGDYYWVGDVNSGGAGRPYFYVWGAQATSENGNPPNYYYSFGVRYRGYEECWSGGGVHVSPATQTRVNELWAQFVQSVEQCPVHQGVEAHTPVRDLLQTPALSQYGADVVDDYLDERAADPMFPYTYPEPYGPQPGTTFSPTPNKNPWFDNPYSDPQGDEDDDGFTDWEEEQAGTDATDPGSVPTVSPDPNRDRDGDGYPDWYEDDQGTNPDDPNDSPATAPPDPEPDADADGVPDALDPCPFTAVNQCEGAQPQPDPIEIPEDYAREGTQQSVLSQEVEQTGELETQTEVLQDVLEELRGEFQAPAAVAVETDTSPLEAFEPVIAPTAADGVMPPVTAALDNFMAAGSNRLPFAMTGWLDQSAASISTAPCPTWPVEVAGNSAVVTMCGNAAEVWMRETGRPILTALLWFAFAWTIVLIGLRS